MDKLKTDAYYILGNCPYELDAIADKIADILVTIEDKVNEIVDHVNQQHSAAIEDKVNEIIDHMNQQYRVAIEDKVNELVDHVSQQPSAAPDSEAGLIASLDQATRAELDTLISDISKVLTIATSQASDPSVYAAAARHRMSPNLTTQCRHDHIVSTVDAVSSLIYSFFHLLFYRQDIE